MDFAGRRFVQRVPGKHKGNPIALAYGKTRRLF